MLVKLRLNFFDSLKVEMTARKTTKLNDAPDLDDFACQVDGLISFQLSRVAMQRNPRISNANSNKMYAKSG